MLWSTLLHLCGLAVTTLWLRGERVAKVTLSPLKCFSNRVTVGFVQAIQDSVSGPLEIGKTICVVEDFLQLSVF